MAAFARTIYSAPPNCRKRGSVRPATPKGISLAASSAMPTRAGQETGHAGDRTAPGLR
jgi:hypothetical protein